MIVVAFWRATILPFSNYDDHLYIYRNDYVREGITPEGCWWALSSLHGGVSYWHPLTWFSHMLDVELFGLHAPMHHTISLLLHIGNTLLTFRFFRLFFNWKYAFIGAVLFGLHPMHIDSVVWLSERKDLLWTGFAYLTINCFDRFLVSRRMKYYGWSILFYLLSCLSKPSAVIVPGLLLLIVYFRFWRIRKSFTLDLIRIIPYCAMAGILSVLTLVAQRDIGSVVSFETIDIATRLVNIPRSYGAYITKALLPINLSVFYEYYSHVSEIATIGWAVVFVFISALVLKCRCFAAPLFIGWCWFFVSLLPVIGIIQSGGQSIANRYTYLSYTGLFLVIIYLMKRWLSWWLCALVVACLVPFYIYVGGSYLSAWNSGVTLWERAMNVDKDASFAPELLGEICFARGDLSEAEEYWRKALRARFRKEPLQRLHDVYVRIGDMSRAKVFREYAAFEAKNSKRAPPMRSSVEKRR